jgi:rhodanese-related sulfurtransferase
MKLRYLFEFGRLILAVALVAGGIVYVSREEIGGWRGSTALIGKQTESNKIDEIDLEGALILLQKAGSVFVDVRSGTSFRSGHIKGAVNIPFEELVSSKNDRFAQLAKSPNVVVYCDGTSCGTAYRAAHKLQPLVPSVLIYAGGWQQWKSLGLPYETN